jgi:hypothetical protein
MFYNGETMERSKECRLTTGNTKKRVQRLILEDSGSQKKQW